MTRKELTPTLRRPRIGRAILGSMLGCILLGCTENNVIVDIDVASFLDAEQRRGHYQAPANSPAADHDLAPFQLRIDGNDPLGSATEVTLDMEVEFDNRTGRGQGRFIVFLADRAEDLYATEPVAVITAPIAPATRSTGATVVTGNERVLELFRQRSMWVGIRLHWEPEDPAALDGDYAVTRLHARVLTSLDLL